MLGSHAANRSSWFVSTNRTSPSSLSTVHIDIRSWECCAEGFECFVHLQCWGWEVYSLLSMIRYDMKLSITIGSISIRCLWFVWFSFAVHIQTMICCGGFFIGQLVNKGNMAAFGARAPEWFPPAALEVSWCPKGGSPASRRKDSSLPKSFTTRYSWGKKDVDPAWVRSLDLRLSASGFPFFLYTVI